MYKWWKKWYDAINKVELVKELPALQDIFNNIEDEDVKRRAPLIINSLFEDLIDFLSINENGGDFMTDEFYEREDDLGLDIDIDEQEDDEEE